MNERDLFIVAAKKLGINTELVETPMGLMFKYGSTRDSFDIWQASASRDGYKLVPVEPSDESINFIGGSKQEATLIYKAMIGAVE